MLLAMCFDGSMLISLLFFVVITGALVLTPVILGLVALSKWADARQKRMAAADVPADDAGWTPWV
jgi:hypothetical protein